MCLFIRRRRESLETSPQLLKLAWKSAKLGAGQFSRFAKRINCKLNAVAAGAKLFQQCRYWVFQYSLTGLIAAFMAITTVYQK